MHICAQLRSSLPVTLRSGAPGMKQGACARVHTLLATCCTDKASVGSEYRSAGGSWG